MEETKELKEAMIEVNKLLHDVDGDGDITLTRKTLALVFNYARDLKRENNSLLTLLNKDE